MTVTEARLDLPTSLKKMALRSDRVLPSTLNYEMAQQPKAATLREPNSKSMSLIALETLVHLKAPQSSPLSDCEEPHS
jgi:hypothetical protein